MVSKFVISLDLELLWGVRDHASKESYETNILGARRAIPKMLALFEDYEVSATWATVGFLFCRTKDELLASLPPEEFRPTYQDDRLSTYRYLDEVGLDEKQDPFYFGASLIDQILQTPGQEIGTHTLTHYYCLEPGQKKVQFEADLSAALALAKQRGITISSIVFPRNQFGTHHLPICQKLGLTNYRGTPDQWIYRSAVGRDQTLTRRLGRLVDAHTGIFGDTSFRDSKSLPVNVPASQFLRPCVGKLAAFHSLHRLSIKRGMTRAAEAGCGYHLWWHPHNFGRNIEVNLESLKDILIHYQRLKNEFGMRSLTMAEAAR